MTIEFASGIARDEARDVARNEARRVLREFQVSKPPIRVEEIAEALGARIARHRFDGPESGFALREGGTWIIGVNIQTSHRRQRFTIAHELGHLLLHEGRPLTVDQAVLRVDLRNHVSSMATDLQEIQANTFAATLLMPEEIVFDHVTSLVRSEIEITRDDLISRLARTFGVSIEAMGYRLINLGILTA
jgi:Zn-dependent peptidase ImmA (M78 family)